jgi:alanine-glyoxylate transaminase / serine-glyoxylate transaminase / serine-pyruvate transaminase
MDDWGIDICYSGTQKCLSCPPGLSPFSVNSMAITALKNRATKVKSWYLDLALLSTYWSTGTRFYHHTAPISMVYALHEALALIVEEGLETRVKRHLRNGGALQAGLEAMGLVLHAQKGHRLSSLTTVRVPDGIDELKLRQQMLIKHNIEIGGGLGPLKGKIWRIGLMGHSSTAENVLLVLSTLGKLLSENGFKADTAAGQMAATRLLS